MSNQPAKLQDSQTIKSILCHECKNEFQKAKPRGEPQGSPTEDRANVGDNVQCPTCGTTLTIISVDEKGTGKTRPVPEEK